MRFSAAFLQDLSKFLHRHMTDFYDVQSLTITVTSRGFFASLINFVPSTLVFPRYIFVSSPRIICIVCVVPAFSKTTSALRMFFGKCGQIRKTSFEVEIPKFRFSNLYIGSKLFSKSIIFEILLFDLFFYHRKTLS